MFSYNDNRPFIGCQIHHFWLHSCYNHYFVYISSLVCQYYIEHFIFTNWKLKCIDRWTKQGTRDPFYFSTERYQIFVHMLMQKYVTPIDQETCVSKIAGYVPVGFTCWEGHLFIVTETDLKCLTLNFIPGNFCLIWRNQLFILFCKIPNVITSIATVIFNSVQTLKTAEHISKNRYMPDDYYNCFRFLFCYKTFASWCLRVHDLINIKYN